jgi:hypothetical protein
MASSLIVGGAVALGSSLVSLISGYFWGRSNVRSQIEDALDKARVSADAREFTVREELDERLVELAQYRTLAEEVPGLRRQIQKLESERPRISAGFRVNSLGSEDTSSQEQKSEIVDPEPPPPESADTAIEKLLKSIEERMNQPEEAPPPAAEKSAQPPAPKRFAIEIPPAVTQLTPKAQPAPAAQPSPKSVPAQPGPRPIAAQPSQRPIAAQPGPRAIPAQPSQRPPQPKPIPAQSSPKPPAPAPPAPAAAAPKDEWQEFAASLAALKNLKK